MLVLSRKIGEKIYIGENICICIVDIDRGKVRIGLEVPRDTPIYRQEVMAKMKEGKACLALKNAATESADVPA